MTHTKKIHLKSRNGICPLCKSSKTDVVFNRGEITTIKYEIKISSEFKVMRCSFCGLVFQDSIFTRDTEKYIFRNQYDDLKCQNIETDSDPYIDHEIKLIKKLFGNELSILDFGSFWGTFALKAEPLNVFCYEVGKKKIEYHKKLNLKIISELKYFDIIRVGNVLSHLHNDIFETIKSIVEKCRFIYIIDLNGDELNFKNTRHLWHVNTFTKKSLNYISECFNLQEIHKEYYDDGHFGVIYDKKQ